MTVRGLLDWAARTLESDTPRLDAEVLLGHVLGRDRGWLFTWGDRPVGDPEVQAFHAAVARRMKREPVAYITGRREFHEVMLRVTPDVLIPRPETELLVEVALKRKPTTVLDLCTGSGAVAVAVARALRNCRVTATDISPAALEVARQNAVANDVADRVSLRHGDLWEAVKGRFDLILANPPYVSEKEHEALMVNVRDYEPRLALVAEEEGLAVIGRIAEGAGAHLEPSGALAVEIGANQGAVVRDLLERLGYRKVHGHSDLAGHPRVIEGEI